MRLIFSKVVQLSGATDMLPAEQGTGQGAEAASAQMFPGAQARPSTPVT